MENRYEEWLDYPPKTVSPERLRLFYPLATQVVAVSDGVADNLARFTGLKRSRIRVVYNPVARFPQPQADQSLPGSDWWTSGGKRILAVGTLKPEKGYVDLLQAFKLVTEKTDARLLIVGEGPERSHLAHQIESLGLSDCALMCGAVPDAEPYYPQADLFVLSSLFEGLPTVLIEALAAGIPIVSTDCPSGPREILQGGHLGTLVPPGQPDLLAQAILSSLAETRPDTIQARQNRARDFSLERGIENYLHLLQE